MDSLLINLLISLLLFFVFLAVVGGIFYFIARKIRRRGEIVRSLNMELFLILIPREGSSEQDKEKTFQQKIESMEHLFSIFSNLKEKGFWHLWEYGKQSLVWEMVYQQGEISFYVAVPKRYTETLVRAVHAMYPDAVVEPSADYDIFRPHGPAAASYVRTALSSILPIRTYRSLESDPLQSIAAVMANLPEDEHAAMQVIMRPTKSEKSKARKVAIEMQKGKSLD